MKWSMPRDDVPQTAKQQIVTQELRLTVIWRIDRFHVVDLMIKQHSYSPECFFCDAVKSLLLERFPDGQKLYSIGQLCKLATVSFILERRLVHFSTKTTIF
jgi:hypothetical protein